MVHFRGFVRRYLRILQPFSQNQKMARWESIPALLCQSVKMSTMRLFASAWRPPCMSQDGNYYTDGTPRSYSLNVLHSSFREKSISSERGTRSLLSSTTRSCTKAFTPNYRNWSINTQLFSMGSILEPFILKVLFTLRKYL